ncbi:hypothetical protein DPEC_G00250040 [Dallia pectoralis]|uniref:Uncharacterized protein n=1 Tax=Dallia pectoralis TaxID=75939 RepID=A0ACC2FT27_DALPE|nr:hypothetical protein DPEC_G00250040 [Dallia pectoralis]
MNSFYWKSLCLTFVFLYVPIAGSEDHFKVKVPPELVAVVGNEITLPCRLNTNTNISTVVWSRRDLSHSDVLRYNYEAGNKVNNSYKGRVSDLNREELERGIASIRLIHVQRSDEGEYKCTVTARMWADEATIRLSVIGVGSRPEIWKLEAVEGGLWLQCRSNGWFPKPEMFWLDSDGRNLTSESGNVPKFNYTLVEGLYTVTGEVAVTRGDANRFLCRIHFQKNNLTTETEINISGNTFPNSDDLFWKLWDIYKTTAAFSGLVILLIIPGFILHKKGVFERLGYFSKQLRFLKYRNPPGYEDIIQNRVSVKLDSCRAHSHLRVDCDCEQVSYQGPGSPQSQQQSKCEYGVLGTNQFSGKHYFENMER